MSIFHSNKASVNQADSLLFFSYPSFPTLCGFVFELVYQGVNPFRPCVHYNGHHMSATFFFFLTSGAFHLV